MTKKADKYHSEFHENIHPDLKKAMDEPNVWSGNVPHIVEHLRQLGVPAKDAAKAWSESLGFAFNPPRKK